MKISYYICSVVITKLKIKMEKVPTLEQLKPKMQIGDYEQVAKMLGCSRDAAKMRLRRGYEDALCALQTFINEREKIINNFQTQNQ
jgi:hypothetical protein